MKYGKFDVVKLLNGNKAIILKVLNRKEYFANIINDNGITLDNKSISNNDIEKIIYSKKREIVR